jgi:TonB family protein
MRTLILVVVLTSGVVAQSEPATSLAAARELYASADYRGALEMLDRLAAEDTRQDRPSIDLYRAFCLIALDRVREADEAIAAMITRDPLYRPADAEVPPRLRPMFSDKRRVVLPGIIQARYEHAKSAFDQRDYKTAADGFTQVLIALSDPDIARETSRAPLADLRVLAIGFKDLAVRAVTPPSAPASPPPPSLPAPRPEITTQPPDAPRAPAPRTTTIYDSDDAAVVAPVTVTQDMPRLHRPTTTDKTGVLVVVINEAGRVESAVITQPLDSYYDAMLLQAAKTWRYQPARRDGVPVKYRKRIQLTLPRQTN